MTAGLWRYLSVLSVHCNVRCWSSSRVLSVADVAVERTRLQWEGAHEQIAEPADDCNVPRHGGSMW